MTYEEKLVDEYIANGGNITVLAAERRKKSHSYDMKGLTANGRTASIANLGRKKNNHDMRFKCNAQAA